MNTAGLRFLPLSQGRRLVSWQLSDVAGARRRRRYLASLAALGGLVLMSGFIVHIGLSRVRDHLLALGPLLPVLLTLTGLRYLFQTTGWRLAMQPPTRVTWALSIGGVMAGEAVGYLGGGTLAREPVKALFVRRQLAGKAALAAALPERLSSIFASVTLMTVAAAIIGFRAGHLVWPILGAVSLALVAARLRRIRGVARMRSGGRVVQSDAPIASTHPTIGSLIVQTRAIAKDLWRNRRGTLLAIVAMGLAQETINVLEAYLILGWLGAGPSLATTVAFEGANRAMNAAAVFVPGRAGVSEASSALLAGTLRLGSASGLSLALARRARSLIWVVAGLVLLLYRTARWPQHEAAASAWPGAEAQC